MGTTCEPCEKGKWKAEEGFTSCNLCDSSLKHSTTTNLGSFSQNSCVCPAGKFDDLKGNCEDITMGMSKTAPGMTLASLSLEPKYWRTSSQSKDVRECPVSQACIGGNATAEGNPNATDYCLQGHTGPYCNLCDTGYAKDAFLLCQSCDTSTRSIVISVLLLVFGACAVFGIFHFVKKRNLNLYKRLKNCVKIIFTSLQITSSLPTAIPAMPLPKTVKAAVSSVQFFNLDVFKLVSAGCLSAGYSYYHRLLTTTIPIIVVCSVLILVGIKSEGKRRSKCFTSTSAILYLTLPTVTTTVFQAFSCDELDDDRSLLRADYR